MGGPLNPILANIYLDRFDEFMERRGHRFVRYADDLAIFVLTSKAAERVIESSIRFFKGKQMKLKVDREKSCFGSTVGMKLLGFEIHPRKGRVYISVHSKAVARFKKRVIQLTKRNRGYSSEQMFVEPCFYLRGWMNYFGIATSDNLFKGSTNG